MAEQARLYAQGRTAPGAIVTKAQPGSSWHNFGLAFDVAPLVNGRPAWPNDEALWDLIGRYGKAAGLDWGGDFLTIKDRPHFEYHPGLTLAQARAGARPSV
jgi:peptidoglycan L-alanyl-D-glutamate endopeptidase CwlK